MKQWQVLLIGFILAVVFGVGGYQLQQYQNQEQNKTKETDQVVTINNPVKPKEVIGTKLEDFHLFDTDGQQRQISEWQGKTLVLNFWATWCAPCREEIPAFVELQDQYRSDGLQFVGIALQEAEEVRDFLQEFNVNYPSLVGSADAMKIAKQLGNDIGALPYTVVIDRNGIISFTHRGPLLKSDAEKVIQKLL
ncbi:MAG: TlpA family protein disulfide reductase [Gammaproteobacteria bacterium]|jgi:peroxiredoxin